MRVCVLSKCILQILHCIIQQLPWPSLQIFMCQLALFIYSTIELEKYRPHTGHSFTIPLYASHFKSVVDFNQGKFSVLFTSPEGVREKR